MHASARRAFATGKGRHTGGNDLTQLADQPRQNTDGVPQQGGIGRPVDVGFHNGCVDTKFVSVFQTIIDSGLNHGIIDLLHRRESQPIECLVEGVMLRYGLAVKTGEVTQRVSIPDALAQFASRLRRARIRQQRRNQGRSAGRERRNNGNSASTAVLGSTARWRSVVANPW